MNMHTIPAKKIFDAAVLSALRLASIFKEDRKRSRYAPMNVKDAFRSIVRHNTP